MILVLLICSHAKTHNLTTPYERNETACGINVGMLKLKPLSSSSSSTNSSRERARLGEQREEIPVCDRGKEGMKGREGGKGAS